MLTSPGHRFLLAVSGLITLIVGGMLGYMFIEGFPPLEALYMSVVTISTVGFSEVRPLSSAGRIFTIVLIITGVGTSFYLLAVIAELLIEGRLREHLGVSAMHRRIQHLEGHVIICGFGRFGRVVAEELQRNSIPLVVIDPDPARAAELSRMDLLFVTGSALDDAVLNEVAIASARAIVAATGSDADNVYITLSAREKNPAIRIHARAESEAAIRRLSLAGADQVVSVFQHGGMRVAATILRPSVVDFLELTMPGRGDDTDLEEIRVGVGSTLVGRKIVDIEHEWPRLRIVALKRAGKIMSIPDSGSEIHVNDHLVAIGDRPSLKSLTEVVTP